MSLAQRTVTSSAWNIIANSANSAILFVRSVLLARLLPVEPFGIYGYAAAVVGLSAVFLSFGMSHAFLHRAAETANVEEAAAAHFTLKLIFALASVIILTMGAFLVAEGEMRTALLFLTVTTAAIHLCETPRLILTRRVDHRRLVLIDSTTVLLSALVAIGLALRGATLWALLATDLVAAVVALVGFYVWRPVWNIRMVWSSTINRYFVRFVELCEDW